ncbi:peptidoglycan DD-metalloendopeptidase family protein [Microbacterium murale]|uniref:Murein DD-endopeptidase MepM/ murein hydrolase activator NlpD n=1 Tax=Microbacterium murale TaxID=1081040 RepID=A0ABU0PAZ0_9MICO|nr:peptidoglycan DD-metalloendopeptidase family protein [Microbacterium murale]MDQ0644504.1 murein DD-endopeptidase MepM/ murein hydrolase activator NlpD [Microbacterium murale]
MTLTGVQETTQVEVVIPVLSRRAIRDRQRAATGETKIVASENVDEAVVATPPAPIVEDSTASAENAESAEDAFIAASRAFRALAGEQPAPGQAPSPTATVLPAEATAVHVAPRKPRSRRKILAAGATVGIMGIAGLLAVSMTLPAEAVAAAQGIPMQSTTSLVAATAGAASEVSDDEIQAYVASSDVRNEAIQRTEDYSTLSRVDLAAEQGIAYSNTVYTNDPSAAIQWPFIVGVGMSYGYGMRDGRLHEGIDLVPGAGAPVQAIADGTVRIATESGGNYGVTVYIDHVIDGALITSHYSHMQYGSLRVAAGETVKVGDIIGLVGNTGRSYGAHMHFELIVNDSTIDPLPWLQANAGRKSY